MSALISYVLLGLVALTRFMSMSVSQNKNKKLVFPFPRTSMVIIHQISNHRSVLLVKILTPHHFTCHLEGLQLKCRELNEEDSIYTHFLGRQGAKQTSGTCPIPPIKYEMKLIMEE
ncbi:hypothetical protein GGU11DRAFT_263890 [Lentinula aff. detonsa]|nr:hypothetical protein GGU11DRAFT_263890 [Lentinula aff. detonsa]